MTYTKRKKKKSFNLSDVSTFRGCQRVKLPCSSFKRSRWVWVCFLILLHFSFSRSQVWCLCTGVWFIHPALSCFLSGRGCRRLGLRANMCETKSRRGKCLSSFSLFGSLLWVLLHADGRFGPYCFTGKHSRPPLCQSTDSTNKTPQVLLVVCCNPVHVWLHLPAPPVNRHFFPS